MFTKKDVAVVNHLRKNSRIKITNLSKQMDIPVTTLYSKLRNYENSLIKKHTCLLNFGQAGYHKSVYFAIKVKDKKIEMQEFLAAKKCINTLLRVNYGFDFLIEGVFKDEKEVNIFQEEMQKMFNPEIHIFNYCNCA